jgi:predicted tellurium resistance membrane protein TerC
MIDRFVHLHYGLATILILLGAEFVLEGLAFTYLFASRCS